jgi:hypothetical protein
MGEPNILEMLQKLDDIHAAAMQAIRERDTLAVEIAALRADAERARWCEEMKATVSYNGVMRKWTVIADEPMPWRRRYFDAPDRNAAIDAAMNAKKETK